MNDSIKAAKIPEEERELERYLPKAIHNFFDGLQASHTEKTFVDFHSMEIELCLDCTGKIALDSLDAVAKVRFHPQFLMQNPAEG